MVHRPTVRGLLELPRAQSPFACARSSLAHRGLRTTSAGVPLRPRSYGLMRRSSTLPLPTDDPWSTGLCRLLSAPAGRRTFPTFSLRLFPCVLGPLPRRLVWCTYPFLPTRQRPSPREDRVGAPPWPYSDFRTARLARLQSCTHVQAHRCARHPGRSYRHITLWQPWLLRPSLSRVVTSPCPGYAYRPHRAIDGMGTFTPSDTQPCRLLPQRWRSAAAESGSERRAYAGGSRLQRLVRPAWRCGVELACPPPTRSVAGEGLKSTDVVLHSR